MGKVRMKTFLISQWRSPKSPGIFLKMVNKPRLSESWIRLYKEVQLAGLAARSRHLPILQLSEIHLAGMLIAEQWSIMLNTCDSKRIISNTGMTQALGIALLPSGSTTFEPGSTLTVSLWRQRVRLPRGCPSAARSRVAWTLGSSSPPWCVWTAPATVPGPGPWWAMCRADDGPWDLTMVAL